ncbi:MAG: DMT family transporter, partial [Hyphomicrobiaceae bacterium]
MVTVAQPAVPDMAYQRGVVLVLLAGTCWSIMGLAVRFMETATVAQILVYRSLSLSPFLLVLIAVRSGGGPWRAIRESGLPGIYGGMALVVAFAGGIAAIQLTTVANALFLFAAAPFFAAVLGWAILGEQVRAATWLAMVIGCGGIGLMVSEGIALGYIWGNLLAVLSALGFAIFTIALRWRPGTDMLPVVFLGSIFSLGAATAFCLASGIGIALPLNEILLCLGLGVFQ